MLDERLCKNAELITVDLVIKTEDAPLGGNSARGKEAFWAAGTTDSRQDATAQLRWLQTDRLQAKGFLQVRFQRGDIFDDLLAAIKVDVGWKSRLEQQLILRVSVDLRCGEELRVHKVAQLHWDVGFLSRGLHQREGLGSDIVLIFKVASNGRF